MAMTQTSDNPKDLMQQCIENCIECHRVCIETMSHCLGSGGIHAEKAHIRTLLDCAHMCQTCSDFMLRESDLSHRTCAVCSETCRLCADDCTRVDPDDDVMRHCIQVCRRCAESCDLMAI